MTTTTVDSFLIQALASAVPTGQTTDGFTDGVDRLARDYARNLLLLADEFDQRPELVTDYGAEVHRVFAALPLTCLYKASSHLRHELAKILPTETWELVKLHLPQN